MKEMKNRKRKEDILTNMKTKFTTERKKKEI